MTVSPALLSVLAIVIVNSVLFAFYLGKLSSRVDRNGEKIATHEERVSAIEKAQEAAARDDLKLGFRLDVVEKLAEEVKGLRSDIAASRTAGETERAAIRRHGEKMEREIGGIHRQLANIASGRTGLLEITTAVPIGDRP